MGLQARKELTTVFQEMCGETQALLYIKQKQAN